MARDPEIEKFLDAHGVKWHFDEKFKVSDVDIPASRTNQARIQAPIDDEQVLIYSIAMEAGEEFPPLILQRKTARAKAIIVDGNHRLTAKVDMLEKKTFESYVVVGGTDLQNLLLTFKANEKNGLALTLDDRVRHAITLVAYGAKPHDAAKDMGIKLERLQNEIRKAESYNRLSSLGVKRLDRLSGTAISALYGITNDPVLKEIGDMAVDYSFTAADVQDVVATVKLKRSEADQLRVVRDEKARRKKDRDAVGGPKSPVKTPRVVTALRRITNSAVNVKSRELKSIPRELRGDLALRCTEASQRLETVAKDLMKR